MDFKQAKMACRMVGQQRINPLNWVFSRDHSIGARKPKKSQYAIRLEYLISPNFRFYKCSNDAYRVRIKIKGIN